MISDTKFTITKFKVFTPKSLSRDKCLHLIVKKSSWECALVADTECGFMGNF